MTLRNSKDCRMKVDMSRHAITRRLQRVSELVRVCRALAGARRKPLSPARDDPNKDGEDERKRGPSRKFQKP